MKHDYTLYEPSTLIRDFHEPTSTYYHTSDVTWSPFTRIGSLGSSHASPSARMGGNGGVITRVPVFPAGFSLNGIRGSASSALASHPRQQFTTAQLQEWLRSTYEWLAAFIVSLPGILKRMARSHKWVPTTYSLKRGLQADFTGRLFRVAKVSIAGLAVLLLVAWAVFFAVTGHNIISISHKPAHPQSSAAIQSGTNASLVSNKSDGENSTADTSGSTSTFTSANGAASSGVVGGLTTTLPDSVTPVVGGMGGGPVSDGSSPVIVPSPPVTPVTPDPITVPSPVDPLLPPEPITVPSVNVDVGSTPVLSTPPLDITL